MHDSYLDGFIVYPTYRIVDDESEEGKAKKRKKALVYLFGRLENGESFLTITDYKPYFYIKNNNLKNEKLQKVLKDFDAEIEDSDFKNFSDEKVTKIILTIPADVPQLRKYLEAELNIECYEADIRFYQRFLIDHNIKGSLKIKGKYKKGTYVDRIYENPEIKFSEWLPELKVLSIDIETDSKGKGIYCISLYTEGLKEKGAYKKVLLHASDKDIGKPLHNAISINTEKEMLEKFAELVKELDPDIITGWNVIDFDLKIIKEKFDKYKIPFILGRTDWVCKLDITSEFMRDSSADFSGRMVLDGIQMLRTSFVKLENYKLETAANVFLGEKKLVGQENKGEEIERLYKHEQQKLVDYNLKDSELVYKILYATSAIQLTIQRSMITGMTLERVRASVASLDSLFLRYAKQHKIVLNNSRFSEKDEAFKGGYVMDSAPGIYDYVLVLDFKSLYPSIIRTLNIDPYSFVKKEDLPKHLTKDKYIIAANGAVFKNQEGILPMIIQDVWKQRDEAKKHKKAAHVIYALKIIMNSFYGVLGNPSCRFYNPEMSNAITYTAEEMIKLTTKKVEELGYDVIYGDSVTKDTEVIIKNNIGIIEYKKISELFTKPNIKGNKEYDFKKGVQVLTLDKSLKSAFKPIKYVMRHKTDKKIYRIHMTNRWHIDVTEDHSLIGYINKQKNNKLSLDKRLIEVKPKDIGKKIKSLICIKRVPRTIITDNKYPKEFYEFTGYFIGDGSFNSKSDKKNYYLNIAAGIDQKEIISKIILPLQKKGWIKNYWIKKKGDIILNGLKIVNMINNQCRNNKKSIPKHIFYESDKNINAFLRGLFSADGTVSIRNNKPIIRFTNTDDEIIDGTSKLLNLLGISHSIFKEGKSNKYHGKISNTISKHIVIYDQKSFKKKIGFIIKRKSDRLDKISKDSTHKRTIREYDFDLKNIKRVEKIKYDDYVYDIEVEGIHRFFANNILVHNTDSVFVVSKATDNEDAEKIGKKIEKYINEFYDGYVKEKYHRKSFFEIQFEKLFKVFLMPTARGSDEGSKKRYAGLLIVDGKEEMSFTGMEFVRSDWTDLSKKFQMELFEKVFKKEEFSDYIRTFVEDLKNGKYDDLLIYKKNINKPLSEYTKTTPPHVKAARKLKNLTSNQIQYIITVEGPEPIEKLKHKPDYEHYVDKQIKPIADTILSVSGQNFSDIMKNSTQSSLFNY